MDLMKLKGASLASATATPDSIGGCVQQQAMACRRAERVINRLAHAAITREIMKREPPNG